MGDATNSPPCGGSAASKPSGMRDDFIRLESLKLAIAIGAVDGWKDLILSAEKLAHYIRDGLNSHPGLQETPSQTPPSAAPAPPRAPQPDGEDA
ncbi:hypothetical protein SAMN06295912_13514 [Sphingomonas laterariae]|uniref:Uncharacterized protein n=1 Tax=Edaphosphingomonas laterariae TaxID=861865 RepID=A0A239JI53_9SPHN|nr:hypothetical protein SAMN06295912_13514 [Sphingomonas laterariae]